MILQRQQNQNIIDQYFYLRHITMAFLPPPSATAIASLIAENISSLAPAGCEISVLPHPVSGYRVRLWVANHTAGAHLASNLLEIVGILKNIIPLASIEVRGGFELLVDDIKLIERLYPDETEQVDGRRDRVLQASKR